MLAGQVLTAIETKGAGNLEKLFNSGETWIIGPDGNQ
jgi:hypothetical protein